MKYYNCNISHRKNKTTKMNNSEKKYMFLKVQLNFFTFKCYTELIFDGKTAGFLSTYSY